ncbi:ATPase, P-type (transporting), HAD superfamily, subfamily IC [Lachnoclostridium phytofermentans ISDg]|uniref:ATPase, P-type (Transporting), HAD superfamily, subfamily IC n=1 Tax=Lachnoclostridium phytofermentans (strain ATCC 700394 / DSM 18823 / ISDg) TaxID=357809 RepID=A9KJQ9_LACP7|nr:ATPase, P-type (transporting), HAD superfamily, subfamily IC [Lachnoclostridium phytofermentans ISDg]
MEIKRVNKLYTEGLSEQEILLRQEQGLTNAAPENITKTTWQILRENIFTVFNAFNLVIGICLALVGAWTNMVFLVVILTNILIGIFQELHAKRLVESLRLISALKAYVIRDGRESEVTVEDLVLDDITVLRMGKQVCADSVVVYGEIEVNESLLTGESDTIVKRPGDTLLSGSFVVSGTCYAKVEHVGADNFISKLAMGAKKHKKITSELLTSMRKVTKFTGFFIIPVGILLFLEAYFIRSNSITLSVVLTSAALLGMLPKGLVLIISISLATGVIKLSKKNILVQEMHCIETLAHVDMLCLDKTGTITEGKMRVVDVIPLDKNVMPVSFEEAASYFTGAMDDNNATFMALKEHFPSAKTSYKILAKTPFSSHRKWSGITFENLGTIVLGAPEIIMGNDFLPPKEIEKAQKSGQRILYFGFTTEVLKDDVLPSVKSVAAVSFCDPIRSNAKETLSFFKNEGVNIKIISGDNPLTVSSIAEQAGLEGYNSYIDMTNINTEEEVKEAAAKYKIFGRVTPNQKSQLVKALQAQGHTVAMTGDGVNDVLALREADCSIAIGAGSDAARQISQLVLLDSDFSALPNIVMEGRRVVNNIRRVAGIFFIKTIYSVLLSILSILTLSAFPFIPIQITLIDAVIEAFPAFFLSFEPSSKKPEGAFLDTVIKKALPYSLLILISYLAVTWLSPAIGISEAVGKTAVYYLTGFISLLALIKSCKPFNKLRVFLCTASVIGFYAAAYLFSGMLNLEKLTLNGIILFFGIAACCVPLQIILIRMINKLFPVKKAA